MGLKIHAKTNVAHPSFLFLCFNVVLGKTYHYKIYNNIIMDPFQRHFAYHSTHKLNADLMRETAHHFLGTHDFSAFANASHNDGVPNPIKSIVLI